MFVEETGFQIRKGQRVRITGGVSAKGQIGELSEVPAEVDSFWVGVCIPDIKTATETTYVTRGSVEPLEDSPAMTMECLVETPNIQINVRADLMERRTVCIKCHGAGTQRRILDHRGFLYLDGFEWWLLGNVACDLCGGAGHWREKD